MSEGKDPMQDLMQKLSDNIKSELNKAHADAFLYGLGFIKVDQDFNLSHITIEDALNSAQFIKDHALERQAPDEGA